VVTTYKVKVLSGCSGAVPLSSLIYDFSGSSYHYNADFSNATIASVVSPTLAKAFTPKTITPGGLSTLDVRSDQSRLDSAFFGHSRIPFQVG